MYDIKYLTWTDMWDAEDKMTGRMRRRRMIETYNHFCEGDCNILLSTDVFGRGVDFPAVKRVINWDPPFTAAIYLNRIGRMGRVNQKFIGEAITYRFLGRFLK